MFIQDTTPDTSAYMIAGYSIFFILMLIYLVSLFIRSRNLTEDLVVLESMANQGQDKGGKMKAGGAKLTGPVKVKPPAAKRKTAKSKANKSTRVKKKATGKK